MKPNKVLKVLLCFFIAASIYFPLCNTQAKATYTTGVHPDDHPLAGYQYYEYSFTGEPQEYISPANIETEIEVWGASANQLYDPYLKNFGRGGYSRGRYQALEGEILYVYVGGMGKEAVITYGEVREGGWNGGGNSLGAHSGGGGASDIRMGGTQLEDRIIVAGGSSSTAHGGGLEGENGGESKNFNWYKATGGTQLGGGEGGFTRVSSTCFDDYGNWYTCYEKRSIGENGTLGKGGDAKGKGNGGGGGGGYYGGGGGAAGIHTNSSGESGGGGSSYIGGVLQGETITGANEPNSHGKVRITPLIPPNSAPEVTLNK